jgi:Xaa-Pro aminopeptidase
MPSRCAPTAATVVREALVRHDLAAIVLFNPVNIRYACDARNMQVYGLHNPCRYVCLTADGHTTLFEFRNCEHLSRHLETVDEIRRRRRGITWRPDPCGGSGRRVRPRDRGARPRAQRHGATRIAFDRLDLAGAAALAAEGLIAVDGLALLDFARAIKSADEIKAMCDAIRGCEEGLRRMRAAHRPGITEQALWSVLCHANAELGGEWMETRLLSAGQRTNPWYNECGDYVIQPGDLVSFDTDLVGRHGYSVDISRSWLTEGARRPTSSAGSTRSRTRRSITTSTC